MKYKIGDKVKAIFQGNIVKGEVYGVDENFVFLSFERQIPQSTESEKVIYAIQNNNVLGLIEDVII